MRRSIMAMILCAVLTACGLSVRPDVDVDLSADIAGEPLPGTFTLTVADTIDGEPQRVEAAIQRAFEARGMMRVAEEADLIVHVQYSMGPPITVREIVSVPQYRDTRSTPEPLPGRQPTIGGVTTRTEYIGDRLGCETWTRRDKILTMRAQQRTAAQRTWSVIARVRNSDTSAAYYAPILAAAAATYLARTTDSLTLVTVSADARRVMPRRAPAPLDTTDLRAGRRPGDPC